MEGKRGFRYQGQEFRLYLPPIGDVKNSNKNVGEDEKEVFLSYGLVSKNDTSTVTHC